MSETVVVRLPNWLGDTVMAEPMLRALRASERGRIALVGPWAALLADQGLADTTVVYPRRLRARVRAAAEIRPLRATIALLLPNSLESALAACAWGVRRRIGFAADGRGWLLTDALPLPEPRAHQVDEYCLLVERFGAVVDGREPRLRPPDAASDARAAARRLLADVGAAPDGRGRLVGIHLGAAFGPAKLWPLDHVAAFCALVADVGDRAVLLGPADAAVAAAAVVAGPRAPSLVGRDRPLLLPALLAELGALVAGDTGVAHLAAALGTPTVALFGPTDPRLTAPRGPATTLVHPVPCAPCFCRACPIEHPCLRGIEPARVLDAMRALVGART